MKKRGKVFCMLLLASVFMITSGQIPLKAEKIVEGMVNFYSTLAEYEELTGNKIESFNEAPMLSAMVAAGEIPPIEERLPEEPMVMVPLEKIGQYGGKLRGAALSPTTGGAESWTCRAQPLLMVSPDLHGVSPNVAKDWDFSEDYKLLTIYLRKGMKWSDGAPFTADDFVFWYKDILENKELVPVKPSLWKPLEKVEKVDDYTVNFHFDTPYVSIIDALAYENRMSYEMPFAPKHYLKKYLIKYNPQANILAKKEGFNDWIGLFQHHYPEEIQKRWDVNVPTIDCWTMTRVDKYGNKYFERNPYYWKIDPAGNQLPYIDEQERIYCENLEAVTFKAIAGELDYVLQFATMGNYPVYKENEKTGDYHTNLWYDGRGNVLADVKLNFNHKDPVLRNIIQNLKFRQALSLCVDRDRINEVIWRGFATPRAATISENVSFYEDWMGNYYIEYDPERANRLLDEMGLKWDENHEYRLRPDGKTLTLSIQYVKLAEEMDAVVELIKGYWEDVGIKTPTRQIDPTLSVQLGDAGELDLMIWNLDGTTELGFHANPLFSFPPYAVEWRLWMDTNGEKGQEPPEEYKRYFSLVEELQKYPIGTPEYKKIGKEMVTLHLKQLWHIGTVGMTPKPCLIKNGLKNVKERGAYVYTFRFWMIYHPEQWYWE